MASKRTMILMGVLLVLVLVYTTRPILDMYLQQLEVANATKPLEGNNSLSNVAITQDKDGKWIVSLDYFYNGERNPAFLQFHLMSDTNTVIELLHMHGTVLQRGNHHLKVELIRPNTTVDSIVTRQINVKMRVGGIDVKNHFITQTIVWPDLQTWIFERSLIGKSEEELLKIAVVAIDTGAASQLDDATRILERLIARNSQFDPAYVELARIAMKKNWGEEGLHQAENILASALKIRPESADAKILLGYVYTHQKRYPQADALFVEAAKADTPNLWLWANWGGLLAIQGKLKLSEVKYREAVNRSKTNDTYDHARLDAYSNLLALLEKRKDIDGMEVLYKQRTAEFGNESCYSVEYAQFLLQQRGDTAAAIALASQSMQANCDISARDVLGLAHYVVWSNAKGEPRNSALDQARVFLPAGPRLLYLLASSERTNIGLKQLISSGESIEQLDNNRHNALSYALSYKNFMAVRRLIKLGARTDAPVGNGRIPVALIPVMNLDVEAIKILQKHGVDYSKLRYKGATALDHAKQIGDKRLIEALSSRYEVI